jgi:hypothetical protein
MGEPARKQRSSIFSQLRQHRLFVLVLACYLIASSYLCLRLAPLSGPDEAAHYRYITYIRDFGEAPPKFNRDEGRTKRLEPPAYYTLVAIVASTFDDRRRPEFEPNPFYAITPLGNANPVLQSSSSLLAARFATMAFGALGLIGLYVGVVQLLGVGAASLAAALLAVQPNYLFFSATLNNDIAVVCAGLWLFAAIVGLLQRGGSQRRHFWFGALWGTALLVQANALVFGLALPIAWLGEYRRNGTHAALRCIIDTLAGFAVFYGPWWLNRLFLTGPFDSPPVESFAFTSATLLSLVRPNWHFNNLSNLRPAFYLGLPLVGLASLALKILAQQPRKDKPGFSSRPVQMFLIALAGFSFSSAAFHLSKVQPQANRITAAQLPATAAKPMLRYGPDQALELAAIEAPSPTTQGQVLSVPVFWQAHTAPAQNYAIQAQLLIPNGPQTAQLDAQTTFPGHGTSPTRNWREGDLIADSLTFIPTTGVSLNGPTRAVIVINWLQLPTPPTQTLTATLPVWRDGAAVDFPSAQVVSVRPAQPIPPPPEFALTNPARFGESIQLIALSPRWEDGRLKLALWWQASADVAADLTTFVHILNANGALIAQHDGVPNAGLSPTLIWRAGDVIKDEREIDLNQQKELILAIGLYDSISKERVSAQQAGQPLPDNLFRTPLPH